MQLRTASTIVQIDGGSMIEWGMYFGVVLGEGNCGAGKRCPEGYKVISQD